MIDVVLDIVSWILILSGAFFVVTGAIGLVRLPDVYTRMHGAGVVDTLGAGLFLAANVAVLMDQTGQLRIVAGPAKAPGDSPDDATLTDALASSTSESEAG